MAEKAEELARLNKRIDDLRRRIAEQRKRVAETASWPHLGSEVLELLTRTLTEYEERRDELIDLG